MILKRVTDSLRRQDWTAVFIEFVLVVVGVLLGFQINEWANERAARQEQGAAAERLLLEAEETVAFFRLGLSAQEQLYRNLESAISAIESGRSTEADHAKIASGLARATEMTTPEPPSSVYDDLVSSGEFGRIGDPEMRAAVARYISTLRFHRESIEYLRHLMPRLEDYEGIRYAFNSNTRRVEQRLDVGKVRRNQVLKSKLAIATSAQAIALVLRQRNLKRAIEMCRQIGRVAGRACRLDRPLPSFD